MFFIFHSFKSSCKGKDTGINIKNKELYFSLLFGFFLFKVKTKKLITSRGFNNFAKSCMYLKDNEILYNGAQYIFQIQSIFHINIRTRFALGWELVGYLNTLIV